MKRARDGEVGNYPDTRKNPIKRMQLERIVEFLHQNKELYQDIVKF